MKIAALIVASLISIGVHAQALAQVALRQSDAVEILIGPIFDATDLASGTWTPETALTIEDSDVLLTKCTAAGDCAAQAAKAETTNCAHVGIGVYECDLNTSDTDTVGVLRVDIQESGTAPVWDTFVVVEEAVYDASLAASATPLTAAAVVDNFETQSQADPTGFHVNVMEQNGTAQTANDNGADINAILDDTDDIGVAGAGLTEAGGTGDQLTAIPKTAVLDYIEQFACDSGDADTCVDAGLAEADGFWRGVAVRSLSGTTAGMERCVIASDQSSTDVTVAPPFPASLGTGTVQLVANAICAGVDPTYTP
jgi:hypothetical protein